MGNDSVTGNWTSPTKPWELCSEERQDKLRMAWGSGNLRWKLDPSQQVIYDQIYASHPTVKASPKRTFALDVSRQSGKDFLMLTLAIETCLRRKCPTRIPYAAPTQETVKELLAPTAFQIFQDCPPELAPAEIKRGTFNTGAHTLTWPQWGCRIVLVGVDLHPDWLRGPATYAFFLTEPAFMENLDSLMESIMLPQLLTQPDGFGVMASTPPTSPGHPWSTKYIPAAKLRGMYAKRTILDCPRFSKEQIDGMIEELGGMESTRVRRELFCEHIVESQLAVVPEFQEVQAEIVTDQYDLPEYRDCYVALDPGFSHATGALFAYFDFIRDLAVIEGDFAVQGANSSAVARLIWAREWQLWGREPVKPQKITDQAWRDELALIKAQFYADLPIPARPVKSHRDGQVKTATFLRISDTDSRLIADMSADHGIMISPTEKDDSETALNAFRVRLQNKKFLIHPRCVNLITHLSQGTWNKSRTKLAESAGGGHFDCIPAAVYLNRNLLWGRNPLPPTQYSKQTHHVPPGQRAGGGTRAALKKLFGKSR